jgi:sigma-B regulation protein RsbU (phosphoserine phosphatase)
VTFFYAQLDGTDGTIRYINAGHNAPLVYSREQNDFRPLHDGGSVLGLFQDVSFNEGLAKLESGDVLVAYTDGVTEAESALDEEFGEERLRAAIEAASSGSAKEILDHISGEVAAWSNGVRQHDDITLVVLKKSI